MNTIRAFIAIELNPPTHHVLSAIQSDLKKTGADASWVKPENMHLTLKFLGEVPLEKIDAMCQSVGQLFPKNIFTIELTRLGAFPAIDHPQTVWIGIEKGKEEVCDFVRHLEETLEKLGIRKERRAFDPHVTLGRVRSGMNRFALFKTLKDYPPQNIVQDVRDVIIFKSTLTPRGPVYEVIKKFPLS